MYMTQHWEICDIESSSSSLQKAANQASEWSKQNNMKLNIDKTKEMTIYFGRKVTHLPPINIDGQDLECVSQTKLLGVILNKKLTWQDHIDHICSKAAKRLYFLRLLRRAGVPKNDIIQVYTSIIRSMLEYACEVWHPGLTSKQSTKIEQLQKRVLRITHPDMPYLKALDVTNLTTLLYRREERCRKFFLEIAKPSHVLHHLLPSKSTHSFNLRSNAEFSLPHVRTDRLKNSPIYYGVFKFQSA